MKHRNLVAPIAVLCALAAPLSAANTGSSPATKDTQSSTYSARSTTATTASERHDRKGGKVKKANEVLGKKVHASDGVDLGSIGDLVIDSSSGKITHAVVRAGGVMGIGGTAKAVPFDSLEPSTTQEGMTVEAEEWQNARSFREDQLAALSTDSPTGTSSTATASDHSSTGMTHLVLASKLDGMEIKGASGDEVGEIEGVLIHADQHKAALLVEVDDDLIESEQTYVISFNRIQIQGTEDDRRFTTELAATDFQNATTSSAMDFDSDEPFVWNENATAAAE